MEDSDERYMRLALRLAEQAAAASEVPVGCLIVAAGRIVGRGYNQRQSLKDVSAHAEILALRQAAAEMGGWQLDGAAVFVTLEPCAMCAGAIVQSRIRRLVYGAADPKTGAAGSVVNLLAHGLFNHGVTVRAGVLADECGRLLSDFFRRLRGNGRENDCCGSGQPVK